MAFSLSSQNVFDYLIDQGFCTEAEKALNRVELKPAKNFNLLVSLSEERKLLVKQEPYIQEGKTAGEFLREWHSHQFFDRFSELHSIKSWLPEVVSFDAENSIMIIKYLDDHRDLIDFYSKENVFPTPIAASIGTILATIHRLTLNRQEYQDYFSQEGVSLDLAASLLKGVGRIGPEVFGQVPVDGLKFFALYQRYDSLGEAIAELGQSFTPCCLAHNDLKLNNILLPADWEQAQDHLIQLRLIDWERSAWGDPAFDLGSLIASYLGLWLGSFAASKSMGIEETLRLAITPLETLQPSIAALLSAYFEQFPEILEVRPDFLQRVTQFAGLGLIQNIQSVLQYQKTFGNSGICMLQAAKTLLCRPEASLTTICGVEASELIRPRYAAV